MYESRIAADQLTVAAVEGVPPAIDALAVGQPGGHGFLRAAWYAAGAPQGCRTLVLRRGTSEGHVLAAIPTAAHGPALAGVRKVPGCYWPLRTVQIAPDCSVSELAHALGHRAARGLGAVWRAGPVRCDDPATGRLIAAAQLAGWSVLSRPAGTSWVIDLDAARAQGWPRPSTVKRLDQYWRKLENLGTPHWRRVRGGAWNDGVLADMGRIEAESWIARTTDGSGAKFMTPAQRQLWQRAFKDPVLAENLTATILMLDDRPIAFSFDLDDGPVQYGIAGSYVQDLRALCIGKLANYRAMEDAIADGQSLLDMGAGDTGYKREMGAVEGYQMADLLFVRSRTAARVLALRWGEFLAPQRQAHG
jgi:CelD/BcsL family acetyltransferase involved in cellulose biosynthesis